MRLSSYHLPLPRLSASALSDALICPEKFRRERLLKEYARQSLDGFIGSVHHRSMQAILDRKMEGLGVTSEEVGQIHGYAFHDQLGDEQEPEWTTHPDQVRELGVKMLASAMETIVPEVFPEATELWFEEPIPGLPVPIVGKIDAVAKTCNWEFKTTKQKASQPKAKWRFQARVYQLVSPLDMAWGITTKQKTPVSYTPSHPDTPGLLRPMTNPDVTVKMILNIVAMVDDLYVRFGAADPWPMSGLMHEYFCSYCQFGPKNPNPTCPAWRDE